MHDFQKVRSQANGMLSLRVYQAIYEKAHAAVPGHFIEVGTAHGAATIVLALGKIAGATAGSVYSFEKIVGGSREKYGSVEDNLNIIQANFKSFNVDSSIHLFIGDVEDSARDLVNDEAFNAMPISLLMLDADGAIDRDLELFYNRLLPGSPIIIDDCNERVKIKYADRDQIKIDSKHLLTYKLVSFYLQAGLLEQPTYIGNTLFCIKPTSIQSAIDFSQFKVAKVYRTLTFLDGTLPEQDTPITQIKATLSRGLNKQAIKQAAKQVPLVYPAYRTIKSKLKRQDRFATIKELTQGYLAPEAYREIYTCSVRAQSGVMIDIGPAQGGSSISIGLGIQESNKIGQAKVFNIEKGIGSRALTSLENVELNAETLRKNIKQYGLDQICFPLIGDVRDVHPNTEPASPVSLLFIDADGALDRDFSIFYNRILPGSPIILDDYINKINRLARERYLTWSSEDEIERYVIHKDAKSFLDLCPLGKEFTVYQFVNYFLEAGLIEQVRLINSTFFGRKTTHGRFEPDRHGKDLRRIREDILRQYYAMNSNLKHPNMQRWLT